VQTSYSSAHPLQACSAATRGPTHLLKQPSPRRLLADGYYEWKTTADGKKQPYRITLKTGEPFAVAGIYGREPTEYDTPEKNPVNFAILTTKANDAVSHIHERMPVSYTLIASIGFWVGEDPKKALTARGLKLWYEAELERRAAAKAAIR
jgi:hypothetical protein